MNFGKITFGALLLAVGVLLLAVRTGFAHPDTPIVLLRYWPIVLIAFGLAFLAGAIKNPMLGCFAILIILGSTLFGMFWMDRMKKEGKLTQATSSLDLAKANVSSLLLSAYSWGGSMEVGASPSRTLSILRRDAVTDSSVGYRFDVNAGRAVLVWPASGGTFSLSMPGAKVDVRGPSSIPFGLRWSGKLSSLHADLTHLRATTCSLHEIFSSSRIEIGDAGRPAEIRVWGLASDLKLRIPADCPVRVVSQSPFVIRSFPSDFDEHAPGRGKNRIDSSVGRGRPVQVYVDGPLMHITIERMPQTADTRADRRTGLISTQEVSEWPLAGTASRSRSPSS